ncbi:indolepyruvate ferredoxin oxidoreductase subunit alpha [Ignisphaera sp. 4213-co]|uniref:Indolepyruvate oxidoreductase subunit IorA n=1 Tax=Ignisphaera cupida TaxID=3050454 RepID=A0ABD4Z871_9CREN|nr:indolepyruvate ferredoxin oxidoreductase subunit alpha [Ignisphaera sp. 4213-co]MDK6029546.1 indolepyruvate ferredoxin oxidoreductase subunit alpha [Ignisphaera sp. 4213-co]
MPRRRKLVLGEEGTTAFLLGNEAIARGAIEYGIGVAAAYPGTPSSEIIETLADVAKEIGLYVEWSINEKTAFELAYAAAMSGVPSLTAMKHVGLNVASDPLMTSGYTGVKAGFIIVTADDPYMHSSQNEQDNRWYGLHAYLPVLEPCNPQEAKDLTYLGLEYSEKFEHPVILRSVTRVSHARGLVKLGAIRGPRKVGSFPREPAKWAVIPAHARKMKINLLEKWRRIEESFADFPYNRVEGENSTLLIVASGIGYSYAKDALKVLGLKAKILKIATPVPLPRKLIEKAVDEAKKILVVEETDPVVEMQLKSILFDLHINVEVHGSDYLGKRGELTIDRVAEAIAKTAGFSWSPPKPIEVNVYIPPRKPVLCPGCPHRATFYALIMAARELGVDPIYSGDIGCYSLGIDPPFNAQDVITNMGGSIGLANGFAQTVKDRPVVAIIGDSTFFHAGIPPFINAVYNKAPMLVLVLDNETTAMTGFQPHPGTGLTAVGEKSKRIYMEEIAKAVGVDYVEVFDPYNTQNAIEVIKNGLRVAMNGGVAFLVARRACSLLASRLGLLKNKYTIDSSLCAGCLVCVNTLGCPAIVVGEDNKPYILESLCTGCGVCAQICPFNAIIKKE